MLSNHDVAQVGSIVAGDGTWFQANLLRLIAKAHGEPRELLRQAFPYSVALIEDWETRTADDAPRDVAYYVGKW